MDTGQKVQNEHNGMNLYNWFETTSQTDDLLKSKVTHALS